MKMTKYLLLLLGILPTAPLCAQWELKTRRTVTG